MGSKQTDAQRDVSQLIRGEIKFQHFNQSLYPEHYAALFLQRHWSVFWRLLPDEIRKEYLDKEFELKDCKRVVRTWSTRYDEDGQITADWLLKELADAYLTENNVTKP